MINIFVTYRCNLACPYCFAGEQKKTFPEDMSMGSFHKLLQWLQKASFPAVAFIGGEPTLHPHLIDMLTETRKAGMAAVLFTNGLYPSVLNESLAPLVSNFVVNYNDPAQYTPKQSERLHANLAELKAGEARITFSKNFSRKYMDYKYVLEGLDRYGVKHVRYDISRPSSTAVNEHFTVGDTREIMSHVVDFVKACDARGVRTGLDCSLRLCDVKDEDRRYLERVSMKFTGVCHPSIDVHPDLSASYCQPMRDICVDDVTAFADQTALMWHFAQTARSIRKKTVTSQCLECKDFMRRCQGGCMAMGKTEDAGDDCTDNTCCSGG